MKMRRRNWSAWFNFTRCEKKSKKLVKKMLEKHVYLDEDVIQANE